jgi:hypothetical protein
MNLNDCGDQRTAPPSPAMISDCVAAHRARGYQLEMLERSLKENIIIAVGCSKTVAPHNTGIERRWILGAARLRCMQLETS